MLHNILNIVTQKVFLQLLILLLTFFYNVNSEKYTTIQLSFFSKKFAITITNTSTNIQTIFHLERYISGNFA